MNISSLSPSLMANMQLSVSKGQLTESLKPSAKEEFLEYARMSPAERLRAQILEEMKLSEDGIASMEPEARAAVEDEIKRRMMEALTAKDDPEPGSILDMTA
jgi:TPP-dependent pyruvate/acetoin dehydrogenase alpha subunit